MRPAPHFLLIADDDRSLHSAITETLPAAKLHSVPTYFDAIAELGSATSTNTYTAILASAEPIERRPEAAVKTLRSLAGPSRLILFGHSTLEPLQRKMLEFGCDDYLITPAARTEIADLLTTPGPRLPTADAPAPSRPPETPLLHLPLTDLVLESLVDAPHNAAAEVIRRLNTQLPRTVTLDFIPPGGPAPAPRDGSALLSFPLKNTKTDLGVLYMSQPTTDDEEIGKALLAQLAPQIIRLVALQDRYNNLHKLAITDELTGLFNGRFFKHFLTRILEKALDMKFEVTLMLIDIDDFKKYNDRFGHSAGDEILKQTATLMKRCCRDHDIVARISGDEFAVIFWEKDPPRQPREEGVTPSPRRTPVNPTAIFERLKKLLAAEPPECLGPAGKDSITVSAGMANFPWNAQTADALIAAADNSLMFGAKKSGKNSCHIFDPQPPTK